MTPVLDEVTVLCSVILAVGGLASFAVSLYLCRGTVNDVAHAIGPPEHETIILMNADATPATGHGGRMSLSLSRMERVDAARCRADMLHDRGPL